MSRKHASGSPDPLFDADPNPPLPQEEYPENELATVVEPKTDGSRRCIFYPEDADETTVENQWLAVDNDVVVSIARWK